MNNLFELTYTPRYGDFKDFEVVKPSFILDLVQDVSIQHSNTLGYTIGALRELEIAWLMQGIKAEFLSPVSIHSPVTLKTSVASMRGASSERGCLIIQNGKTVAKTVANWFTFDICKQRPCRVPAEIGNCYPIHDFEDLFFNYKKPDIPENAEFAYEITVRNKDIDTNMHLNNQKSAEMLMDALPFDYCFTKMNVFYKNPAFLGDKLGVYITSIENGYFVQLKNSDGEICVAGEFTE